LKIPNTKRADGVAQGVAPEFKPQYCKNKNKNKNKKPLSCFEGHKCSKTSIPRITGPTILTVK
jgi:hypothetical protein